MADQSGATAVMIGLAAPVLILGMGLGAETGYWYFLQRQLQQAADVSAYAAGVLKRVDGSEADMKAAALRAATASGFSSTLGTLTFNNPPSSGAFTSNNEVVEVILRRNQPRLISSLISEEPLQLSGRAAAQVLKSSSACVLALSPTASEAITITGSAAVTLNGCDIASNSNAADSLEVSGSGSLSAGCAHTVGEADVTAAVTLSNCANQVQEYAPPVLDPYKDVPEPSIAGQSCEGNNVGGPGGEVKLVPTNDLQDNLGKSTGIKAMYFCSGLTIKGDVHFSPGVYIIDGDKLSEDLSLTGGAKITGENVTFYFRNSASMQLTGNGNVQISAPTSGIYSGILVFGSRNQTGVTHQLLGTTNYSLNGAIYAPASDINFQGNSSSSTGCTQIIADTITFTGNSSMGSGCSASGTEDIVIESVKLVE